MGAWRDVHLHPGRGHRPGRRQQPDALGQLHAHRHDRLHHGHRDGDDQRLASHADDHLGQPGGHRLRHGARQRSSMPALLDGGRSSASVPGTFTYTPAAGTVLGAGNNQTLSVTFTPDRHDRLHHGLRDGDDQRLASDADDHLGQPGEHRLRHGAERNAARCHLFLDGGRSEWNVAGTFTYTPAAGTVLGAGNNQTLSVTLHAHRHDRLHHGLRARRRSTSCKRRRPSVGQPGDIVYGTALSGTQLDATASWTVGGVNGSVAGTFTYTPAAGHRPGRRQQPDALGHLHAHRHDRLHHGHRDGDDQRFAGNADHHLGQPRGHRLRHGAERNAAGCHLFLDGGRRKWERGGNLHLHPGRGHRPGRRQQPDALGHSSRPTDTTDYTTPPRRRRSTSCRRRRRITWANPADIVYGTAPEQHAVGCHAHPGRSAA